MCSSTLRFGHKVAEHMRSQQAWQAAKAVAQQVLWL
jgi:hypothetical protein